MGTNNQMNEMHQDRKMRRRRGLAMGAGAFWLFAVCAGMGALSLYKGTAAEAFAAPAKWPAGSMIPRDTDRHTILLLGHPQCPCTRASIGELARLMARLQGKASAYVLILVTAEPNEDPMKSEVWTTAAAIPGVRVLADSDGREAARFQATASGQTLLYDANERLLFQGGITASRGHSGDNFGTAAIEAQVTTGRADRAQTPVFGCSLRNPSSETLQSDSRWKK